MEKVTFRLFKFILIGVFFSLVLDACAMQQPPTANPSGTGTMTRKPAGAQMARGQKQIIYFTSEPSGAQIFINGKLFGETPFQYGVQGMGAMTSYVMSMSVTVEVYKKCYLKQSRTSTMGEAIAKGTNHFVLEPDKSDPQCANQISSSAPAASAPASGSEIQKKYDSIILPPRTGAKPYVAVMDLKGAGAPDMDRIATSLSDPLRAEMTSTSYFRVCDRANLDTALKEIQFQQTGCTSSECVVQVGRILGVDKIVTGSITKLGSVYSITLQMVDVGTALIVKTVSERASCEEGDLFLLVGIAAKKLALEKTD